MADIDDLKATFEQIVGVINRRDPNAYASYFHEQMVAFPPFFPFAVDCKAAARQFAEANLANPNTESTSFTPLNPQYRVIGSTGIVWGHTALSLKPKDGPLSTSFIRFTFVLVKTEGKWLEACVHFSQLPTGN